MWARHQHMVQPLDEHVPVDRKRPAKKRLDRAMVKAAWSGAEEADAVVHLIDASAWVAVQSEDANSAQKLSVEDDKRVMETLKENGQKAYLALNKIDLFPQPCLRITLFLLLSLLSTVTACHRCSKNSQGKCRKVRRSIRQSRQLISRCACSLLK